MLSSIRPGRLKRLVTGKYGDFSWLAIESKAEVDICFQRNLFCYIWCRKCNILCCGCCYIIKEWFFFILIIFHIYILSFSLFGLWNILLLVPGHCLWVQFTLVRKGYENHHCHNKPQTENGAGVWMTSCLEEIGWEFGRFWKRFSWVPTMVLRVEFRPWCGEVGVRPWCWEFEIGPRDVLGVLLA